MRIAALLLTTALLTPAQNAVETPSPQPFDAWLTDLIADARSRGYSEDLLAETLSGLQPIPRVVERDRSQAELTISLDRYFQTRITPRVVRLGRQHATSERELLRRIQTTYGVPPSIV